MDSIFKGDIVLLAVKRFLKVSLDIVLYKLLKFLYIDFFIANIDKLKLT